jgi:hypothetical protein
MIDTTPGPPTVSIRGALGALMSDLRKRRAHPGAVRGTQGKVGLLRPRFRDPARLDRRGSEARQALTRGGRSTSTTSRDSRKPGIVAPGDDTPRPQASWTIRGRGEPVYGDRRRPRRARDDLDGTRPGLTPAVYAVPRTGTWRLRGATPRTHLGRELHQEADPCAHLHVSVPGTGHARFEHVRA